jgi:hypothetical protein
MKEGGATGHSARGTRNPLSDDVRERITTCTDADVLDHWLRRVSAVTRAADLFPEPDPDPAAH